MALMLIFEGEKPRQPTTFSFQRLAKDLRPGDQIEGNWTVDAVHEDAALGLLEVRLRDHGRDNWSMNMRPDDLVRCLTTLSPLDTP